MVGTNSGMDYWNGTLDWTTGLDYWTELFSFLGKFLCSFLEAYIVKIYKYLVTVDDCNNDNSCLLHVVFS